MLPTFCVPMLVAHEAANTCRCTKRSLAGALRDYITASLSDTALSVSLLTLVQPLLSLFRFAGGLLRKALPSSLPFPPAFLPFKRRRGVPGGGVCMSVFSTAEPFALLIDTSGPSMSRHVDKPIPLHRRPVNKL